MSELEPTDHENDVNEIGISAMRLLRAGFRNGDQSTLDGVKERIVDFLGELPGEAVYERLFWDAMADVNGEDLQRRYPEVPIKTI